MVVPWPTDATANNISLVSEPNIGNLTGTGPLCPGRVGSPGHARARGRAEDNLPRIGSTPSASSSNDPDREHWDSGDTDDRRQNHTRRGVEPTKGKRKKKKRQERRTALQVASLNINGYGNLVRDHPDNKWGRLYRMMSEHRIGVLLLQETHLTRERTAGIHRMFAKKLRVFHSEHPDAPTQREGVAIVLNARYVNTKEATATEIIPGRAIQVSIPCQGGDTKHLLCIYAPTSSGVAERKLFFTEVRKYFEDRPNFPRPHLMAGDFNNVEDSIDRLPISDGPDQSLSTLDDLKLSLGLMYADGWRVTNPNRREYTFHRGSGLEAVFSRLDRMYVTPKTFDGRGNGQSVRQASRRTIV